MNNLHALENRKNRAAADFAAELCAHFPNGKAVRCFLSHRQITPSEGTVVHASSDGRVNVQLTTVNRRGHRTIRRVHWTKIQS